MIRTAPVIVQTRGVRETINAVRYLVNQKGIFRGYVLCCFDRQGSGFRTAIQEAATLNNCMRVVVDPTMCTKLANQVQACMETIGRLQAGHNSLSGKFTMLSCAIVPMLANILEEGALCLLSDCLAAIKAGGFDSRTSRAVNSKKLADVQVDSRSPRRSVGSIYDEIEGIVDLVEASQMTRAGIIIHVENADGIFPDAFQCLPRSEFLSNDYSQLPPERMGMLLLRAFCYSLISYIGRNRKIIWAFSGARKGSALSFNYPSALCAKDLSEDFEDFTLEDVYAALPLHSLAWLDDQRLKGLWKSLVGPPVVTSLFCNSICSYSVSSATTLLQKWKYIYSSMASALQDRIGCTIDSNVAKFCCLAPLLTYAGLLDASLDSLHSCILSLADCGVLRIRHSPSISAGLDRVYFDRPYPLLLALFADSRSLCSCVLPALEQALGSLRRNYPCELLALSDVALAFDLVKMFKGAVGKSMLDRLQLDRFLLEQDYEPKVVEKLSDVKLGENSVCLIYDKTIRGFHLHLEAVTKLAEIVRLWIFVSADEDNSEHLRGVMVDMTSAACSHWKKGKKCSTIGVFLGPQYRERLETEEIIGICKGVRLRSIRIDETNRIDDSLFLNSLRRDGCESCSRMALHGNVLDVVENSCGRLILSLGPIVATIGPSTSRKVEKSRAVFRLFYFGRKHEFYSACPLYRLIGDQDSKGIVSHLLGEVNFREVSESWRENGDTTWLVLNYSVRRGNSIGKLEFVERDPLFPQLPLHASGLIDLATCMRFYFDGQPLQAMSSVVLSQELTGLSILDPNLVDSRLRLGLAEADLEDLLDFAIMYREYRQQGSPDPSGVQTLTAGAIAVCLGNWGCEQLAMAQMEVFLESFNKKVGNLASLTFDDFSTCPAPLGTQLAALNIISCCLPRAVKRKVQRNVYVQGVKHRICRSM